VGIYNILKLRHIARKDWEAVAYISYQAASGTFPTTEQNFYGTELLQYQGIGLPGVIPIGLRA